MFWCLSFMQLVPLLLWQLLWLFGLCVVVVGAFLNSKKIKLILMSVGCGLVLFASFFLACYAHTQYCRWAILVHQMPLRVGPAHQYHQIQTVEVGELVQMQRKCGSWCQLQTKVCRGWAYLA